MTDTLTRDPVLQKLLDTEAIRALRVKYSNVLDTGAVDGFDDVFTQDAVLSVTVGDMTGLEAIKQGLRGAFDLYNWKKKDSHPFMHAVTNHDIRITGPDTAEGQCYLLDFVTGREPDQHPFLLLGLYVDQYKRVNGSWKISHTRLDVPWGSTDA
ncbi:nuclear transport factor 2 family protein [Mangrovicoccus ximenensis]|uniref:nuclear transport factor 2 family protein n=1 Tax=Mangrovicoccus ximenensis TaxID=1911570 RepID=UPI000D3370E1|nr:nuclear transport factor 2 family protein [Mangrovicoccus ximenensis]